jgi:hypothetical protein
MPIFSCACEWCDATLGELRGERYRPRFERRVSATRSRAFTAAGWP